MSSPSAQRDSNDSQNQRFSSTRYENLKEEFNRIAKRILKKNLSINPATLRQYEVDIKEAWAELS